MNSRKHSILVLFVIALSILAPAKGWSWGERGHHSVCFAASRLVTQPNLAKFFLSRGDLLGHLCNIPDIHWRNIGPAGKIGDATHFMDFENLDYTAATIPLKIEDIIKAKQGQTSSLLKRPIDVLADLGSSWWRFDQFYRLAVNHGKEATRVSLLPKPAPVQGAPPATGPTPMTPFETEVFGMMTNMGIMGHFIGDAAMPFHNTVDYDGWETNQGGLHSYFETEILNAMNGDLDQKILDAAKKLLASGKVNATLSPVERMKSVTVATLGDLQAIRDADVPLEPSKKDPSGSKTIAKRKPAAETLGRFETLAVNEMALAALNLAQSWDQIYVESGSPSLTGYRSFIYPLAPNFVAPDYGPPATPAKN